ncbi:phosphoglycerate kinase [Hylemonella gracilis str. Niagara R]|uniref:Phosphoglycerate kinase n=1 Tax=Hylemonella gracilis str. Niagara R TaxID=1458275 RepID=A0A016XJ29_9BURK|nr:histidine phosphatase family protein [Hylemonella gracilis]EYC51532.1 phosphoglycerate kinase [Hylemonella gracilis str. Niagara R]
MKLWLVRHAQPLIAPGVCYGISDIEADAPGTTACAAQLAAMLPHGLVVHSSPLRRCLQLAQALCALRPDLQLRQDARLREMDFGQWEGVRWDDIPRAAYEAWTGNFGAERFGGRESVNDVLARVATAREEVRSAGQEAVWVTHAGVLRALALLDQGLNRLDRADQWPASVAGWGEWQSLTL